MVAKNNNNPLLDSLGRFRTKSLFYEYRHKSYPFYWTLKGEDKIKGDTTILSLRKIYMSYDHIPGHEYEFAVDCFRSWEHFRVVRNSPMLREIFDEWADELTVRIKALQVKNLIKNAREGDSSAAKYLVEGKADGPKRGRPSKLERAAHLKQQTREAAELSDIGGRVTSLLERKKG